MATRARRISLPALALVVAIVGTAALLLVTTLRSLERDRERMARELERQGAAIIATLESGARTGMMMRWGTEQLQALVTEAARLPEIAFVGVLDSSGAVVAQHSREMDAPPWPDKEEVRRVLAREAAPVFDTARVGGQGVFEVMKKFVPDRVGRMRGRRGHMMFGGGREVQPPEDWVIVLGLYTGPWERILAEGRRQTLLSFLVILTAGSMALYLGILLQNHFLVRRTLGEMRAYAQNIMENMADGLVSVDAAGKVASHNPVASRILQREGSDLRGEDLPALLPQLAAALGRALAGESEREELEVAAAGAGGPERTLGISVSPLRDEEGKVTGAVLILRDMTEVRHLEVKVREAEKLAALGQMAATVAHEVRNPLSSLRGFAQLFKGKFPEGSPESGYARLMVREVDRLNRTVADLLFYSRPVRLARRRTPVEGILKETVKLLEPEMVAQGQRLTMNGGAGIAVEADPDQLSQVFLNILINAHQAAGRGGDICLRCESADGRCRVSISDNGPGMDPESAARAFEPFFTTSQKGSGLGLAIVKKIVDLHGGQVSISSTPGEGTVVTVELPLAEP